MLVDGLQIKTLTSARQLYRLGCISQTGLDMHHMCPSGSPKRAPLLSFYRDRKDSRRELVTAHALIEYEQ
jgi:hypothetical protein